MKRTILLCLSFIFAGVNAQTTLYSENFNGNTSTFTLNTTDLSSTTTGTNSWLINNSYAGGTGSTNCSGFNFTYTVNNTPNQNASIAGSPQSKYMHICSNDAAASGITNCNFADADGLCNFAENYFSRMSNDISTMGYNNVHFSFWWLCRGSSEDVGTVYYSTDGGSSWSPIGSSSYHGQGAWVHATISDTAFNNKAHLRIGFQFSTNTNVSGSDPAFAIDDIAIAGTLASPPAAHFVQSDSIGCPGLCVTFTDSSSGATSHLWTFTGGNIDTSSAGSVTVCYDSAGTFAVKLKATNAAGSDSVRRTTAILIHPKPNAGPDQTTCIHSTAILAATGSGTWTAATNNPSAVSIANSSSATTSISGLSAVGTYSLYWSQSGCSDTMTITVIARPIAFIISSGDTMIAMPAGGIYQWLRGGTATGPGTQVYAPLLTGSYRVIVMVNGCPDTSAPFSYTYVPEGITRVSSDHIMVRPDPFTDHLEVEFGGTTAVIEIYSMLGSKVFADTYHNSVAVMDLPFLPKGLYLMHIKTDHTDTTRRIVKD